jgi:hypothetical protein
MASGAATARDVEGALQHEPFLREPHLSAQCRAVSSTPVHDVVTTQFEQPTGSERRESSTVPGGGRPNRSAPVV